MTAERPITVVHLLSSAAKHGNAHVRIVAALRRNLDPDRYRMVAWFLHEDGPLRETLLDLGVTARSLPFRGRTDLAGAARFVRSLREEQPALIHAHVWNRPLTWVSRSSSARLAAHFHGTHAEDGGLIPLERLARSVDAVLATSNAVAAATGMHATVVHPGVDMPEGVRPQTPLGAPTIGTVARLEPIKDIDQLIRAAVLARGQHPDLRVEIAGDGSCETHLQELARSLGIGDSVRFLGWRDDVHEIHRRWHAFVIPSRHEGFPLAALEAMSSGVPVVGSATGGLPELIEDGASGFLVPVGDTDALADRISRLLGDPRLRAAMAEAAQQRARRFTTARMSRRIEATYDGMLDRC